MKVVVTGGAGFIGSAVVRRIVRQTDWRVATIDKLTYAGNLESLAEAREQTGLLVVTEVMSPERVPLVSTYADILQIGARNMQNYDLLHAVGQSQRPVMLKRGMMSTIEELLMSAEYILSHGNDRVILCERGIRTFETYTRNTLDISAIPLLRQRTYLPVIVDVSHAAGRKDILAPLARAALETSRRRVVEACTLADSAERERRASPLVMQALRDSGLTA